jgi:2-keto-4-pentenoate hydratase/2-oxohepta-3-ene-1,7-dioic acid hydratase in catechol pathway
MNYVRFRVDGQVCAGLVEDNTVTAIDGSFFEEFTPTEKKYRLDKVSLLPPVRPSKVVCVAHNFKELITQIEEEFPEVPVFFLKPPSSLIGDKELIRYPGSAVKVIYEGELAVIIKKEMRRVRREDALDYVLGYCCFNDVTERQVIEDSQLYLSLGKGFDTFGPIGPYIVSDCNPNNLEMKTFLNGEIVQHDNTKNFIFPVDFLLHYLSTIMTLYPGDVVTSGTPGGVAPIVPGDEVTVEIESIGAITNRVDHE